MRTISVYFLLLVGVVAAEDEVRPGAKNDPGFKYVAEFRRKVETLASSGTISAEKKALYLSSNFNLVCNCTMCSSEVREILGVTYKNICITDGSCVKQILPDQSVSMSCRRANVELNCRSTNNEDKGIACCKDYSFCNGALNITVKPAASSTFGLCRFLLYTAAGLFILSAIFGVIFVFILIKRPDHRCSFWIFKQLCHRRVARVVEAESLLSHPYPSRPSNIVDRIAATLGESEGTDSTMLQDLSSGSGSGLPGLIQRTVARQIELAQSIGRGRFGEVWHAKWRGEVVAVKLFNSRDEQSWKREVEIYETTWLRHPNILAYVASDSRDAGSVLQLWLITEYHEHGSLYDYLQKNVLSMAVGARMARSIASGISFLHFEIENSFHTMIKPGVAHRDIKSKNILVKSDLSCVIADFGLAVKSFHGQLDIPVNAKCGTARYLSPELLLDEYPLKTFEEHKMSDIYSMGLVLWEILRRCDIGGRISSYEVPYHDYTRREPTLEEMKQCVVVEKRRPPACDYWKDSLFGREVFRVASECWAECPMNRLTASSARVSLDRLIAYYDWRVHDYD